ncbi:rhombosortase [Colwellia piezophila]|uniref:rhombosortase n=1 Tax=Colwellia piezophila TaxID=211668 RepID=UPI0003827255|nr:rhombosortase [Colwellia piezophila]
MIPTLKSLPLTKQHSLVVCLIAVLALLAYALDEQVANSLVYQRELISHGQIWRFFTGHFLHTNGVHLLLNLLALLFLWALHGHFYSLKNYSVLFITSAVICSTGLYYFSPDIHQYVGLSGILHGIFIFGAIMDIRHHDKTGYLLLIGVWLKIAHEQFYGPSEDLSALINANVAIDAHLWGAIAGLIFSVGYIVLIKDEKAETSANAH